MLLPINLSRWIDEHHAELRPPVGNKVLFQDETFIVMAVGGPNARKDFHHDPAPEVFLQLRGTMMLRIVDKDLLRDIPIAAGEMYVLPADVPHSPRRPAGTVGLVIERRRRADEVDGFSWYCEHCGHQLYLEQVAVRDIEKQLPQIFARFYADERLRTCGVCGTVMQAPS